MKRVSFTVDGQKLKGEFWDPPGVQKRAVPLVVLSHGLNSCRKEWRELPEGIASAGYAVLAFDYRGHGESEGERGVQSAARAEADLQGAIKAGAKEFKVDIDRVAVIGHSLGAALAIHAAPRLHLRALVALAPLRRIRDEINAFEAGGYATLNTLNPLAQVFKKGGMRIPYATDYKRLFVSPQAIARAEKDPFLQKTIPIKNYKALVKELDAEVAARHVHVPTLVVLAEFDVMVGKHNSKKVYQALAGPKELIEVPHSGHSMAGDGQAPYVINHIRDFLERHLRAAA